MASETIDDATVLRLIYDPTDEMRTDPYPFYRRLRETHPMYWHPIGMWVASRHADCDQILRERRLETVDPHRWQGELQERAAPQETRLIQSVLSKTLLFGPAADHERYRSLIIRAFSPKVVQSRRPRMRSIAERLIERFPRGRDFDFMEAYASPFPILLFADILGIPPEEQQRFTDWSRTITPILDPFQRPEAIQRASQTMREFDTYIRGVIAERRAAPQNDLLSLMVAPGERGYRLTDDELVANIGFLIAAGHGTMTHFLGNGIWMLLRTPGAWPQVQGDRSLLEGAVQEILRMEAPAQMTVREAVEDVFVAKRLIRKGRRVLVLLGAANRDGAVFPDPDRFDLRRSPNDHLAFSGGAHYCLGSSLAVLEAIETFNALLDKVGGMRLAGPVEWQRTITMRGFASLPVRLD